MAECTGTNCEGCEAGKRHYQAYGCTKADCMADCTREDHDEPAR